MSNTIQITRAACKLIKDEFLCELRWTPDLKGRGEMEVWLVIAARQTLTAEEA